MKKNVLMLLPLVAIMGLVSCNKSVSQDDFSKAVSDRKESAKPTDNKKLVFKGSSKIEGSSEGSQGSISSDIPETTYSVTWNGNVPSFKAEGDASASTTLTLTGFSAYIVLNTTFVAQFDPSVSKFYTGNGFSVEENVEKTGSDGTKVTSNSSMSWNGDLLLTSIKTNTSSDSGKVVADFTFNWSK